MEQLTIANTTVTRVAFSKISQLAKSDHDYAVTPEVFEGLIDFTPSLENFGHAIHARTDSNVDRELLIQVLEDQYASQGESHEGIAHLAAENAFTVITAHQPCLLTGPLYFIYKICSAINLARTLNATYPDCHITPVFIIGGEDHDLDEMNHASFFGKTFTWEAEQSGAVGRMHTENMSAVLEQICEVIGENGFAPQLKEIIASSFTAHRNYGAAMQKFVMQLFKGAELLVVQMDDKRFKAAFRNVMHDELINHSSSKLITQSQEAVSKLGYKPQAFVRQINLFYLQDQQRNRIELDERGLYTIVDSDQKMSQQEILDLLAEHPDRFSPNVNLRPVYQETLFPNLAYIGGGGEIAYWLERKSQFEFFGIPYPLLVRRNSVLYLNAGACKQRKKQDISIEQLFLDPDHLVKEWVFENSQNEVDIRGESRRIEQALAEIVAKAKDIEPGFARKVDAFKVRTLKEIEHIGKRLVREEKSKFDVHVQRIRKLHDRLFPGGGLQERKENFIPYYLAMGPRLFSLLIEHLNPLEPGFIVIEETC